MKPATTPSIPTVSRSPTPMRSVWFGPAVRVNLGTAGWALLMLAVLLSALLVGWILPGVMLLGAGPAADAEPAPGVPLLVLLVITGAFALLVARFFASARLVTLAVGSTLMLLFINGATWALSSPDRALFLARDMAWGPSDVWDYQKFPERMITNAAPTFQFQQRLRPDLFQTIEYRQDRQIKRADFEEFLKSTQTTSFMVIKDGAILYEGYFNGYNRDSIVTSFSTAKVADLEAVRQQIGAEQVVLLGDSWGATLVANYMAVHPEHVARVIFTSPGVISRADWSGPLTPASRLPAEQQRQSAALFERPRFLAWQILLERNVQAAYQFIPDAELDGFADTIIASFLDGALCEPAPPARAVLNAGFGFWSMTMTNWDMNKRHFDPHAALTTNTTPALILRGECDYIPASVAAAYTSTLPHATLVTVPQAGHLMYYEQPDLYLALVGAFLLEQPLPPVEGGCWSRQDR